MQRKTIAIQESIPVETYHELLELGNGELKDGIQIAVNLAHAMEILQKSQTNEDMKIWRRLFKNPGEIYNR